MNYFVFRIDYEHYDKYELLRAELKDGRLRQGWGAPGMELHQCDTADRFLTAHRAVWGEPDSVQWLRRKYHNLRILLEIQPGDRIIIPKLSLGRENGWNSFTIAECTQTYSFAPLGGDFGHIIGVKPIVSYSYTHNSAALTVSEKFRAYRSPLNRIHRTELQAAISALMA